MKQLLSDYRRRLELLNKELDITIKEASDITKVARLTIKGGCYRTFIAELERLVPPSKEVKTEEVTPVKKETEDEYVIRITGENERFFKIGKYAEPEEKLPEGF